MSRALIVVDVQNDFCEGGALAVQGGAEVAAAIGRYVTEHHGEYAHVLATADTHEDPGEHWAQPGEEPDFAETWPVHCQAGTPGAAFHPAFAPALEFVDQIFRKGRFDAAYSGFEGTSEDGDDLALFLHERDITAVDVVGIATDHCVRATAVDAAEEGLRTRVLLDLTAGVARASTDAALSAMDDAGVELDGTPVVRA